MAHLKPAPFTRFDVEDSIRELSRSGQQSLQALARLYTRMLKVSHHRVEDLVQEAFERTLISAPCWDRETELIPQMKAEMRSVAHSWHIQTLRRRQPLPFGEGWRAESLAKTAQGLPDDPHVTRFWDEVRALLRNGEERLLKCLTSGSNPSELSKDLSLSQQAQESAMKRIRRTATKMKQEVLR